MTFTIVHCIFEILRNSNQCSLKLHMRAKDFIKCSSWTQESVALINIKLLGLQVFESLCMSCALYIATLLTTDNYFSFFCLHYWIINRKVDITIQPEWFSFDALLIVLRSNHIYQIFVYKIKSISIYGIWNFMWKMFSLKVTSV